MTMTYEQQARQLRNRAESHEHTSLRLANEACANETMFPTFARQLRLAAGREMRLALECYDCAKRAEFRAQVCPANSPVYYPAVAA